MNKNDFFRQATLKICGNLEIEKALFSTLQFLQQVMPVSRMALEYYDKSVEAMRTIAKASKNGGKSVDLITPLSADAKKQAEKKYDLKKHGIYLFDNPKTEKLAQEMLNFHGVEASSLMVLSLKTGDIMLGTLALLTEGKDKFTHVHADLVSLLSEPFAIALSNTLKHRNELRLQDRDFFWEVTSRICGNLEIEEGLQSCIEILSRHMPADKLYLQKYEKDLRSLRLVARADSQKGEKMDVLIPLPEISRSSIAKSTRDIMRNHLPPVITINKPNDDPITKHLLEVLGEPSSSIMLLGLIVGGQPEGALVLLARNNDRFTENHARLYANLRVPFFVAMSNTLKHRSLLKLYDREFFWEVTTRVCGNLEIEAGLRDCMQYLSQHMPADSIYLERYERDLGAMRFVARATAEKGETIEILIPMSEKAKEAMYEQAEARQKGTLPPVIVVNNPDEEPITKHILQMIGEPSSSVMGMTLDIGDQLEGALVLLAKGENRFTDDHAKLFANLKVPFFVAMSNTLKHREILKLKDLLADDNRFLHDELHRLSGDEIIGANFGLKEVMFSVRQVATLDSPVLLLGETGVGKDVIANTIHYSSSRSNGPFVSVNCGAIPETLIDSELFGHEKGAFTGALSQKRGRFERADKGTIFLDEIGELPLKAQVRLLRVIQTREIERVGGTKTIPLDIRIIAATNRNLEEMIKNNEFREDLWFRLNVFPIWIPPLRDRLPDLPALVQHFVSLKSKELKLPGIPALSPLAMDLLMAYHWPGNVRELENIIERALILNPVGPLSFNHMNLGEPAKLKESTGQYSDGDNLDDVISRHIYRVLSKTKGKVNGPNGAAARLGVNPSTLRNRMKKLGIDFGTKHRH